MKPLISFIGILFPILSLNAQILVEQFDDGDFKNNPKWSGDTAAFVINNNFQLQLFDQSEFIESRYLSTQFLATELTNKEWSFSLQLDFSPSSSNKFRYYLAATDSLLNPNSGPDFEAYFLEIGETGANDGVGLYYQNNQGDSLLAYGGSGLFADAFETSFKIILDTSNKWELYVHESDNKYSKVLSAVHQPNFESVALGIQCFFTATRRDRFYMDDFYFGPEIKDTVPPILQSGKVLDTNTIALYFSEVIDSASLDTAINFLLKPGEVRPHELSFYGDSLHIHFSTAFENGEIYELELLNISDVSNNVMVSTTFDFQFIQLEQAERHDIVITEFLADPSPVVGLPENEFIELYNRSDKYIDLATLRIKDNSATIGALSSLILPPHNFVIICPVSATEKYNDLTLSVSPDKWPSLNNSQDSIKLITSENIVIDELGYQSNWILDVEKRDGGYSLEIINKDLACFDPSNWAVSLSNMGGSPGIENTIDNINFLGASPQLESLKTNSSQMIIAEFDKEIQLVMNEELEFMIDGNQVEIVYEIEYESLIIQLNTPLEDGETYHFQFNNITNCNGAASKAINYTFYFDIQPPQVIDVFALADTLLLFSFDEVVSFQPEMNSVFQFVDWTNDLEVSRFSDHQLLLILTKPLLAHQPYKIMIDSLADEEANYLISSYITYTYKPTPTPSFNNLIITELMVNPIEDSKLPNAEYIEVFNPQAYRVMLVGMSLADNKDTSKIPLHYIEPGEYILLCPNSRKDQIEKYGKTLGLTSWTSLNNSNDHIKLLTKSGTIINALDYDDSWYKENYKKEEGGWSLEMIDTNNPCAGKPNWRASISELKGTPGEQNSVKEAFPDNFGPELVRIVAVDAKRLVVTFSEVILEKYDLSNFNIEPAKTISAINHLNHYQLELILKDSLNAKVQYSFSANQITDCVGNFISSDQRLTFALTELAELKDLIINEILYDPVADGVDFIELYNRSDKYINLNGWQLMNHKNELIQLAFDAQIIPPYSFKVLTENPDLLAQQYPTSIDVDVVIASNLPTLPNNEGSVSLISPDDELHQYLSYSDDMHSMFYQDTEGVSLERIHPEADPRLADSWHSASANVNYATPGIMNSQYKNQNDVQSLIAVEPPSFSPYRPGNNFTLIRYSVNSASALATVKIFNSNGLEVKSLVNNQSIGTSGFFRWNGEDDNGQFVGVGYYIIHFSFFTAEGEKKEIKKMVAVAAG